MDVEQIQDRGMALDDYCDFPPGECAVRTIDHLLQEAQCGLLVQDVGCGKLDA